MTIIIIIITNSYVATKRNSETQFIGEIKLKVKMKLSKMGTLRRTGNMT